MAAVTKNLAFGITASTTYDQPYTLARRFTTVDHLSDGRLAWNIVTSYLESAARNYGLSTQVEHDERYRIADEYMDVLYKLWEGSWKDDAVVKDVEKGVYADPAKIRPIAHDGKYFKVPGIYPCEPSRQRTPFLFQAGTSKSGRAFGAKHAEAIFIEGQTPEKVRPSVDMIKKLAKEEYGRDPDSIKFIAAISIVAAETDEAAQAKWEEMVSYMDKEGTLAMFGGWTGIDLSTYSDDEDFRFIGMPAVQSLIDHWTETIPGTKNLKWTKSTIAEYLNGGIAGKIIGGPKTVCDELEKWVEISDLDGFNIYNFVNPGTYEDIIAFVLPELRKRGIFREKVEKECLTAREVYLGEGNSRLRADHPGSQHKWM